MKVEVVEEEGDEFCDEPLALVKRKGSCETVQRDITERFPYIEEVTTTTPGRCDTADDTVTSSVEKGENSTMCFIETKCQQLTQKSYKYQYC